MSYRRINPATGEVLKLNSALSSRLTRNSLPGLLGQASCTKEVQLPSEAMEAFQQSVDWSSPAAAEEDRRDVRDQATSRLGDFISASFAVRPMDAMAIATSNADRFDFQYSGPYAAQAT